MNYARNDDRTRELCRAAREIDPAGLPGLVGSHAGDEGCGPEFYALALDLAQMHGGFGKGPYEDVLHAVPPEMLAPVSGLFAEEQKRQGLSHAKGGRGDALDTYDLMQIDCHSELERRVKERLEVRGWEVYTLEGNPDADFLDAMAGLWNDSGNLKFLSDRRLSEIKDACGQGDGEFWEHLGAKCKNEMARRWELSMKAQEKPKQAWKPRRAGPRM